MKRGVKTHKEEENFDLKVTLFAFAESPVTPKCTMHILKSHLQKSSYASIKMTQYLFTLCTKQEFAGQRVAHRCTIFLCHLDLEI